MIVVFLPKDMSRFQRGNPRNGLARPERPSRLISRRRKLLKTCPGSSKIFICEPALPLEPTLPETFTPLFTLAPKEPPKELGSVVGIAPEAPHRSKLPPHAHTPGPWVTISGSPLCNVKIHDEYQ